MSRVIVSILFIALLFFIWNENAFAAPANDVFRTTTQPDGTTFLAKSVGDEFKHWYETKNEKVIVRNEDGYWYYAKVEKSNVTATSSKVGIDKLPKDAAEKNDMLELPSQKLLTPKASQVSHKSTLKTADSLSSHNLVVLLVSFSDTKIRKSETVWADKIFNRNGNTLNNYYDEVSSGKFQFTPAEESSELNNGVVSVTLDYNHPSPVGKVTEFETYRKLATDALEASDSMINYKKYDKDNNKYISTDELHVVTIIAGGEASYGDGDHSVWGHKWGLLSPLNLDGVFVGSLYDNGGYTQFGEYHGSHLATIGIIAHELGHDLGLPDLYDRDRSSLGIGVHSLMGSGSWAEKTGEHSGQTPTHLDAWSKVQLGFAVPEVITSSGTFTFNSTKDGGYNVIKIDTDRPWEYFLIENRQYAGFDKGLENATLSGGVAIWHIDESAYYKQNDDEGNKLVDLEEASEGEEGSDLDNRRWYKPFNHYYRKGFKTLLNNTTKPNSKLYEGLSTDVSIEITDYSQDIMKGKVTLGNEDVQEPVWQTNATVTPVSVTSDAVSLSWAAASDASGIANYEVYLGNSLIKTVAGSTKSALIADLKANKSYTFKIEAVDKKGNRTTDGPSVTVKTKLESIMRLKGKDRFLTANEISQQTYRMAKTVIIATGYDFPDALAGGPLARKLEAPILLAGKTSLSDGTVKEIKRLKASEAIILGGNGAVSDAIRVQLEELGLKVDRIKGKDRFETAAKIADELKPYDRAIVAYGLTFPDALAIAPYAAQNGYPILLTSTKKLPNVTKTALAKVEKTYVIGGTGVISADVANKLPAPTRYSGKNRFATNADIVSKLYTNYDTVYYASGMNFPDALTGSVAAAQHYAPKFLVTKDKIPKEIIALIEKRKATSYVIVGGSGAISNKVEDQLSN
ncbi:cell wall-binding repeat-containing protein [Alkalihalobacillus sp. R86527]|uniref:cell wall-binding repeat-containing protein n=1 Tax=Alkalihalobacillus sp. R86527 TaxID=3093863 RepID=UPI0036716185